MQKPKPLHVAHADLKDSLHKWIQAKEGFEDKDSWQEGRHSPYDIFERIENASYGINESVLIIASEKLERKFWEFLVGHADQHIYQDSKKMNEALRDGTDVLLDHCEDREVFLSWQAVCAAVYLFARSAAQELNDLQLKYPGVSDYALSVDVGILNALGNAAIECRNRGIKAYWNGPLCEYAFEDANSLRKLIADCLDMKC